MAAITATSMAGAAAATLTKTTLGASDTLTYNTGKRALLIIQNGTAGSVTPVIDGDGATTVGVPGVGSVDVSGGYSLGSVAVGAFRAVILDRINKYLSGTVTVTGASGATAVILEF